MTQVVRAHPCKTESVESGELLTIRSFALSIAALSKANVLDVPLYTFLHQANIELSTSTCYNVRDAAWRSEVLFLASLPGELVHQQDCCQAVVAAIPVR